MQIIPFRFQHFTLPCLQQAARLWLRHHPRRQGPGLQGEWHNCVGVALVSLHVFRGSHWARHPRCEACSAGRRVAARSTPSARSCLPRQERTSKTGSGHQSEPHPALACRSRPTCSRATGRTLVPCVPSTSPTWRSQTRPTPSSGGWAPAGLPCSCCCASHCDPASRSRRCRVLRSLPSAASTRALWPPTARRNVWLPLPESQPSAHLPCTFPAASTTRTPPSTPCPASCRPPRSWVPVSGTLEGWAGV